MKPFRMAERGRPEPPGFPQLRIWLIVGAMGIRTRGLDIKVSAKQRAADKAARAEAKAVVDRWNEQLAAGRDMLFSILRAMILIADKRGHELPDDIAAQREAETIASALRRARGPVWSVIVTNEAGHEVTEIPAPLTAEGSFRQREPDMLISRIRFAEQSGRAGVESLRPARRAQGFLS